MNCDYCKTFHRDTRCPSCGAPVTRSSVVKNHVLSEMERMDLRYEPGIRMEFVGGFLKLPPTIKFISV